MQPTFEITANGTPMGQYQADDADAAVRAYVKDAGYSDVAIAAEACGQSVEEFLDDITVTEATN